MSLSVAIQMDPVETIKIDADSTFAMALEAQARGHGLFHYLPTDLVYRDGKVLAHARPLVVRNQWGDHASLGDAMLLDLATVDVVLLRQDPPFDMAYITTTHLLDLIHPQTLVVNDPTSVRNAPEKLYTLAFRQFMPPTLITALRDEIDRFRREYGDIIIKPLYGNGGAGVFRLRPDDQNLGSLLEFFQERSREPVMVQRYVPEIRDGDKRIILVDGQPVGGVSRLAAEGEVRANFHAGGRPQATSLTDRELEICAAIGPELKARGLIFVGIDVIGDYLTEINVTSPTGIHEINRLDGVRIEQVIWDAIEARLGHV
ncbi:MAG: glutathione synthase [Rhodospirillaceae bacterium]|nr:glutathione synthase [Rhodospirillaceae bacterium]